MRPAVHLLTCLFLLAAGGGAVQSDPRQELLRLINAERQRVGSPPLRLSPALTRAAEEHAAEIARRGSLRAGSTEEMQQRLKRVGYEAHSWTESLSTSPGGPETVLRNWRQAESGSYRQVLAPELP